MGSDTANSGLAVDWSFVVGAARSLAARAFLWPLVWPDGDQAQLRSPLTTDEARVAAFTAALAGPAYALGDDLRTLPADRLALGLDARVLDLALSAAPAIPLEPLESPAAEPILSPVLDELFHPGSTGAPPPTRFSATGQDGQRRVLTFSWTTEHGVQIDPP